MNQSHVRAVAALAFVVTSVIAFNGAARSAPSDARQVPVAQPAALPGLQTGPAPWVRESRNLRARLDAIKLPALTAEGNVLHIHQHLDIFVDGAPTKVPANIGINELELFISPLHTHDTTGVIHVESYDVRDFTLGQFFDVWGVRLTKDCIGGYCASGAKTLRVFSNGKLVTQDPRTLVLSGHQEIAVVFGATQSTLKIPSTYQFAPGL